MKVTIFGTFEIDPSRAELRRMDEPVPIQPKVLRLLVYLVEHRDRVVTNEELLSTLWPQEVVSPASIKRAVSAARRALGEQGEGASSIRSARGYGYQFMGEVRERDSSLPPSAAVPAGLRVASGVFVEREVLKRVLEDSLFDAEQGRGHALLLSGVAGVGKSRALSALSAVARQRSATVWVGRAADAEGAPPYWPFLSIVREAVQASGASTVRALMGEGAADLAQALPELRSLADIDVAPPNIDATSARFRFYDSMLAFLRRASEGTSSLVVVVDDLHMADRPTIELFAFLCRHIEGSRLLLAASASKGWLGGEGPEGPSQAGSIARHARCVDVEGFDSREIAGFVEAHADQAVPEEVVRELADQTGGNPLLLTHLVRLCQPAAPASTPWWRALNKVRTRRGARSMLEHQLRELNPDARRCLRAAAILGRSFSTSLLETMLGADARALATWLEKATAEGLVCEADENGRVRFMHGLVREALVAETDPAEGAGWHAQAAAVLAVSHARGDADAAEVAHHFFEAHHREQALHYTLLAAREARDQLGPTAAVSQYDRALRLLEESPFDSPERIEVLLDKGIALTQAGNLAAARAAALQAAKLARSPLRPILLARAALGVTPPVEGMFDGEVVALLREALGYLGENDGGLRPRLLAALSKAMCHGRDIGARRELAHTAIAAARGLTDAGARTGALMFCHEALSEPEDLPARHQLGDELRAMAHASADHGVVLRAAIAQIRDACDYGDMQTVEVALTTLEQLAERVREPFFRYYAKAYRSMQAMVAGRFEQALVLAEEALRLGGIVGETAARHGYLVQASGCLRFLGRNEAARELIYEGAALNPAIGSWRCAVGLIEIEMGRPVAARKIYEGLIAEGLDLLRNDVFALGAICPLADLCAEVGDAGDAASLYTALAPYADQCAPVGFGVGNYGPVARHLGVLAARQGSYELAGEHFEAARAASARMPSPTFLCQSVAVQARHLLAGPAPPDLRQRAFEQLLDKRELALSLGIQPYENLVRTILNFAGDSAAPS